MRASFRGNGSLAPTIPFFNLCRSRGITGSQIDMLICATAYRHDVPIFTTDPDFAGYARHVPIRLHDPE